MKAAKLRKSIRSALYPTTQYRPLSLTQLSKPWYYSTSTFPYPKYLSLEWLFPGIFQPSLLQYLSTEWIFTWYFPTTPPATHCLSTGRREAHLKSCRWESEAQGLCDWPRATEPESGHTWAYSEAPWLEPPCSSWLITVLLVTGCHTSLTFLGPSEGLRGGRGESRAVHNHSVVSDSLRLHGL